MEESYWFLSLDGLDDGQVRRLQALLDPSNCSSDIEFPWSSSSYTNDDLYQKANLSSLNVHAPAFEVYTTVCSSRTPNVVEPQTHIPLTAPYSNGSNPQHASVINESPYFTQGAGQIRTMVPAHQNYLNGQPIHHDVYAPPITYSQPPKPFNNENIYSSMHVSQKPVSSFKLNPMSSSFVPSNIESILQPPSNGTQKQAEGFASSAYGGNVVKNESYIVKREVESESYVVKSYDSNVVKSNEGNVAKVYVSNTAKVHESNVMKVEECNKTSMQESNVLKGQDYNIMKNQECKTVKEQDSNLIKVESNAMKVQHNVTKIEESNQLKVNESSVLKANDNVMNVSDSNVMKSNNSETTKGSDEFLPEQSSSIENFAEEVTWNGVKQGLELQKVDPVPVKEEPAVTVEIQETQQSVKPAFMSWADIVSKGQKPNERVSISKPAGGNEKSVKTTSTDQESEGGSIAEDKMALPLGKHLFHLELNFHPVLLQPRGLINRRNWCYINATLQALLACPPFYTLLRTLPLGPGVERDKSSTPVIDSMVKVAYEFLNYEKPQEELQVGQPFQPDFIYDMLRDLKSDCLKGQQEDAEEFLSFILNGMHEEMVKIIKNYEKKNHLLLESETKENGGMSDGEDEWQVIGSKHKGMVTRKVAEHKTPISDLLGGQIKSFLTTSGSKTSASIQPFFTLQLDVQSENVTSVSEALKEMTIKEPIQGYTCAKTKQEVEAFSHIALQKLPPILILHLKRFVYNKNGGCKKVMKKTDYPITLEINKDIFAPDVKKSQRLRQYRLFAVMYHDGEEAVKGHYISDVYNHGSQTWMRCDDRAITAVTEEQVLSYSPPRVPYLLFYHQES